MNNSLTYRIATEDDCELIYNIHKASFYGGCASHYTIQQLDACFKPKTIQGYLAGIKNNIYHLAILNGTTIGFSHVEPGEIFALFVIPDYMGKGLGGQFLNYLIDIAKSNEKHKVKLEATLNAAPFYEKHGFTRLNKTSRVCRDGTDFPVINMEMVL